MRLEPITRQNQHLYTTIYDINSDKETLELNLQNALDLNLILEIDMLINKKDRNGIDHKTAEKKPFIWRPLKLTYGNLELQISNFEKVLGIHIDENLKWNNHFQYISNKKSS